MTNISSASESFAQLARVLDALARDWPSFVGNLARLGDAISDCIMDQGNAGHMRDLQAFDTLGQFAQAHGAVLATIARTMSGAGKLGDIESAIARIPFNDMRRNLQTAFYGTEAGPKGHCEPCEFSAEEGAICWL
jgi:hypothetical protein